MTARTLTRDIPQEGQTEPRFRRGETYDFTPHVWGQLCDQLGVTQEDISYPASDAAKAAAEEVATLKKRIAELEAQLAKPKSGAPKGDKK